MEYLALLIVGLVFGYAAGIVRTTLVFEREFSDERAGVRPTTSSDPYMANLMNNKPHSDGPLVPRDWEGSDEY